MIDLSLQKPKRFLQTAAKHIAAVAICVQFLVPSGFMPGAWSDGALFVFCGPVDSVRHHTNADSRSSGDSHHDLHDHSDSPGGDAWEYCPLGAVASDAALAASMVIPENAITEIPFPNIQRQWCGSRRPASLHCRAPPSSRLLA